MSQLNLFTWFNLHNFFNFPAFSSFTFSSSHFRLNSNSHDQATQSNRNALIFFPSSNHHVDSNSTHKCCTETSLFINHFVFLLLLLLFPQLLDRGFALKSLSVRRRSLFFLVKMWWLSDETTKKSKKWEEPKKTNLFWSTFMIFKMFQVFFVVLSVEKFWALRAEFWEKKSMNIFDRQIRGLYKNSSNDNKPLWLCKSTIVNWSAFKKASSARIAFNRKFKKCVFMEIPRAKVVESILSALSALFNPPRWTLVTEIVSQSFAVISTTITRVITQHI